MRRRNGCRKSREQAAGRPLDKPGLPSNCPNRSLVFTAPAGFRLACAVKLASWVMIITALAVSLSACSVFKGHRPVDDEIAALSPRMIRVGDPVPKGGGVFKLGDPYLANGKWYVPVNDRCYDHVGLASWYGDFFHGRQTANGEVYDMNALTARTPDLASAGIRGRYKPSRIIVPWWSGSMIAALIMITGLSICRRRRRNFLASMVTVRGRFVFAIWRRADEWRRQLEHSMLRNRLGQQVLSLTPPEPSSPQ